MNSTSCLIRPHRHPASHATGSSGLRGGHFHETTRNLISNPCRYAAAPFARSLCLGRSPRLTTATASLIHARGILPWLRRSTALRVLRCRSASSRIGPAPSGPDRVATRPSLLRPCQFGPTASLPPRASLGGVHAAAGVHARRKRSEIVCDVLAAMVESIDETTRLRRRFGRLPAIASCLAMPTDLATIAGGLGSDVWSTALTLSRFDRALCLGRDCDGRRYGTRLARPHSLNPVEVVCTRGHPEPRPFTIQRFNAVAQKIRRSGSE